MESQIKRAPLGVIERKQFQEMKTNKHFMYLSDLKKTLIKNKLETVGKKKELIIRLDQHFKLLDYYEKNYLKKIIIIQRAFKNWKSSTNLQGPGFIDKSICVNDEDFLTFETKDEISDIYFFSFREGNSVFFFDIRSFKKLIDTNAENPYTRTNIPEAAIKTMTKRLNLIKNSKDYQPFPVEQLTVVQKRNQDILKVFQIIDSLEVAAGGVKHDYFKSFTFKELQKFYCELEDIWNYRANLTKTRQLQIVPNRPLFEISPAKIKMLNNSQKIYNKLQKIVLDIMELLVTASASNEDRKTGAYYILIGLTESSSLYAIEYPWLVQGF